jgi:hypothetical protein
MTDVRELVDLPELLPAAIDSLTEPATDSRAAQACGAHPPGRPTPLRPPPTDARLHRLPAGGGLVGRSRCQR